MFLFELLGCFVQLDLSSLGRSQFFLEFLLFPAHLHCQLLNLQVELSDFGVVFLSIFLEGDVVFLFLLASDGPLFQFFLVPVEFQLNLFYLLIDPEDAHLHVIEAFLVFYYDFVKLLYLSLQSSTLPFGHLPHVVLSFSFFVLRIDQRLCV